MVVPYFSVHEDEAHQWLGYGGKDKEDLIKFIKSSSRGHEFKPGYEVERSQIARAFQAFRSEVPPAFKLRDNDALDRKIHAWDDYVWIDVGRYLGNIELARDLKAQSLESLVDDAFPNWRQSTLTFEEQISGEMRETAKGYLTTYAEYAARLMSGDFDAVWNAPLLSGVVDSLLHYLPPENPEARLKQVMQFFTSKHFEEMPYLWLSARIYAVLKDMVKHTVHTRSVKRLKND